VVVVVVPVVLLSNRLKDVDLTEVVADQEQVAVQSILTKVPTT
jgi:hypothetical protein